MKYKGITTVQIKDGLTVSMWHDMWEGKVRMLEFPEFLSFSINSTITVSKAKSSEELHEIFQLPLSTEAFQQYNILISEIENLEITSQSDSWTYLGYRSIFTPQSLQGINRAHAKSSYL
jgi:hypothetical protein